MVVLQSLSNISLSQKNFRLVKLSLPSKKITTYIQQNVLSIAEVWNHSFSTKAKFSEKLTFLTP